MGNTYDVIIVGGGIMGSSIAYNLANDGFGGKIVVFEKDPTYEFSSTCLSLAGFREQFTLEVSIKMAIYSINVAERFDEEMAVEDESPNIGFDQTGYLILADEDQLKKLKEMNELQKKLGAKVDILSPKEVQHLVSEINLEGVAGASLGRRDGIVDPYRFLQGYIKKAKSIGIEYVHEEVVKVSRENNRITGLETAKGNRYSAPIVVNATGPWCGKFGELMGLEIPVKPLRRLCYSVETQHKFPRDFPRTINGEGVSIMTEKRGSNLIATRRKEGDAFGFNFNGDRDFFMNVMWPEMAERYPVLESLKIARSWAGLYAMCLHDSNDIIGVHPEIDNLYLANGFSGHGLQQAPAVGKGLSELIRLGRYETIDLSPFRFERFEENDLIPEKGIYAHSLFFQNKQEGE